MSSPSRTAADPATVLVLLLVGLLLLSIHATPSSAFAFHNSPIRKVVVRSSSSSSFKERNLAVIPGPPIARPPRHDAAAVTHTRLYYYGNDDDLLTSIKNQVMKKDDRLQQLMDTYGIQTVEELESILQGSQPLKGSTRQTPSTSHPPQQQGVVSSSPAPTPSTTTMTSLEEFLLQQHDEFHEYEQELKKRDVYYVQQREQIGQQNHEPHPSSPSNNEERNKAGPEFSSSSSSSPINEQHPYQQQPSFNEHQFDHPYQSHKNQNNNVHNQQGPVQQQNVHVDRTNNVEQFQQQQQDVERRPPPTHHQSYHHEQQQNNDDVHNSHHQPPEPVPAAAGRTTTTTAATSDTTSSSHQRVEEFLQQADDIRKYQADLQQDLQRQNVLKQEIQTLRHDLETTFKEKHEMALEAFQTMTKTFMDGLSDIEHALLLAESPKTQSQQQLLDYGYHHHPGEESSDGMPTVSDLMEELNELKQLIVGQNQNRGQAPDANNNHVSTVDQGSNTQNNNHSSNHDGVPLDGAATAGTDRAAPPAPATTIATATSTATTSATNTAPRPATATTANTIPHPATTTTATAIPAPSPPPPPPYPEAFVKRESVRATRTAVGSETKKTPTSVDDQHRRRTVATTVDDEETTTEYADTEILTDEEMRELEEHHRQFEQQQQQQQQGNSWGTTTNPAATDGFQQPHQDYGTTSTSSSYGSSWSSGHNNREWWDPIIEDATCCSYAQQEQKAWEKDRWKHRPDEVYSDAGGFSSASSSNDGGPKYTTTTTSRTGFATPDDPNYTSSAEQKAWWYSRNNRNGKASTDNSNTRYSASANAAGSTRPQEDSWRNGSDSMSDWSKHRPDQAYSDTSSRFSNGAQSAPSMEQKEWLFNRNDYWKNRDGKANTHNNGSASAKVGGKARTTARSTRPEKENWTAGEWTSDWSKQRPDQAYSDVSGYATKNNPGYAASNTQQKERWHVDYVRWSDGRSGKESEAEKKKRTPKTEWYNQQVDSDVAGYASNQSYNQDQKNWWQVDQNAPFQ